MRILFLTNHLQGTDGWSRYSNDLVNEIINKGHEVKILTSISENNKIEELVVLGNPLQYLVNPILFLSTARKVNKIIKSFKPDVIHFLVEPYINILPFLKTEDALVFLTVHGSYCYIPNLLHFKIKKIISKLFYHNALKKLDGIVAVSNYTKKTLVNFFTNINERRSVESKIKVITNGINLSKSQLYWNGQESGVIKKILFVGAIKQRKGILEAIYGIKKYKENYSGNFIYNIIGDFKKDDAYYLNLLKIIRENELDKKIIFYGKVSEEELEKYYRESDLFLMLPVNDGRFFEGFGLVYLEANARAVPVVGSVNCGAEDAIINGYNGYVVDEQDSEAIAEKIDWVLNKNRIKHEMCLQWAKDNSIDKKVEELYNFYTKK